MITLAPKYIKPTKSNAVIESSTKGSVLDFWTGVGGLSMTPTDSRMAGLGALGYTGTYNDMLSAWTADLVGSVGTLGDRFRTISDGLVGMTFMANYGGGKINARWATGSPTATFTATRSASVPATYIDANGVIQLTTTSDVPRFTKGYYDATGFHSQSGVMIEGAGTNLLTRTDGTASGSGLWTGWSVNNTTQNVPTKSQVAATLTGIASSYSQRIQYVTGTDTDRDIEIISPTTTVGSVAKNDFTTLSFWARSQTGVTGANFQANIVTNDSDGDYLNDFSSSNFTLTTAWKKFTFTQQLTDTGTSQVYIRIGFLSGVDAADTLDFEVWGVQLEKSTYATSFVPTTTAALTRGAEVLKYAIANNRTAATESIFIKFAPCSTFANDGIQRSIADTDTKSRLIKKITTGTVTNFYPNITSSSTATAADTTTLAANTSYVAACIAVLGTGNPNTSIYVNSDAVTNNNTDWTDPAWGTYFYLGTNSSGATPINGIIQSVAIFSRALSSGEVQSVTNLL